MNSSGRGHPGDPPPPPPPPPLPPPPPPGASAAAGVGCSASSAGACSGSRPLPRPARGARAAAADFAGNLEFSNTNGSGRGHPGDPPPPPPPPEGANAGAGAGGLQWVPEPARWELRSRSAPLAGAAAAACSPPNSRKARPAHSDLGASVNQVCWRLLAESGLQRAAHSVERPHLMPPWALSCTPAL